MNDVLRMKDLEKLSGEKKSTILYYIREGLLPEPEKKTSNSAVYDHTYIKKIKKIRRLQSLYKFTIREIKDLLQDGWDQIDAKIECKRVFLSDTQGNKTYSFEELVSETEIDPTDLHKLISLQLILPMHDNEFDEEDKAMVQLFKDFFIGKMSLEGLSFYPDLFKQIALHEMAYRNAVTGDLSIDEQLDLSMGIYKAIPAIRYYQGKRMLDFLIRDM